MIEAMTLIGTSSTSVIACKGGEVPTPPTPQADFSEVTGTTDEISKLLTTSDGTVYVGTTTATSKSSTGKLFQKN